MNLSDTIVENVEASETLKLVQALARPRKFLMVDDDPAYLQLFTLLAADFNCEIDLAVTYQEALAKCEDPTGYEFIWLDMTLDGGRTGLDVFTFIKKRDRLKPIILSSTTVPVTELEFISTIGAATFIIKPQHLNSDFMEEAFACLGINRLNISRMIRGNGVLH